MTLPQSRRPPAKSFRQLDVWILAMDLVVEIYALTGLFPADERYGLTAQIRRAAISIPTNVAEGKARFGPGEYHRFISIALGSAAELQTELEIAGRLRFARAEHLTKVSAQLDSVGRMLSSLAKKLTS